MDETGLRLLSPSGVTHEFIRGDADGDGFLVVTDALKILNHLFVGDTSAGLTDAFDLDDTGTLSIGDALYLLNFLFSNGATPAPPYPDAGEDPTPDGLPYVRPR